MLWLTKAPSAPSAMAKCLDAICVLVSREIEKLGSAWSTREVTEAVQHRLYSVAPEIKGTALDRAVRDLVEIQRERGVSGTARR